MSWFQENKFASAVIGATVVVSGVLFYLGMDARSAADKALEKSNSAVSEANALRAAKPYPNAKSKKELNGKVVKLIDDAEAFRQKLLKYRPVKQTKVSPSGFSKKLANHRSLLMQYYKSKGISIPKRVGFGFEKYTSSMASANATRDLEYQRMALEWMFKALADAQPVSLDNIHRTLLPVEVQGADTNKKKNRQRKSKELKPVYDRMPIEVAFTGTEESLKQFVEKLTNGNEYFFAVRTLRIMNESSEAPDSKVKVEAPEVTPEDELGGFVVPDDAGDAGADGAAKDTTSTEPIIKQVLGDEKIKVDMVLDLYAFKPADKVKFPKIKKRGKSPRKKSETK